MGFTFRAAPNRKIVADNHVTPACGSCKWFEGSKEIEPDRGICRRFPPSTYHEVGNHKWYHQPIVKKDDFCGEFAPAPALSPN